MGATPLTARCSRCKKYRRWDGSEERSHQNLEPTGRWKLVNTTSKVLNVLCVEVIHNGLQATHLGKDVICGHVFWSTHPTLVRKLFPKAQATGNAETRACRMPTEHEDEDRLNCTPACGACALEAAEARRRERS